MVFEVVQGVKHVATMATIIATNNTKTIIIHLSRAVYELLLRESREFLVFNKVGTLEGTNG